MVWTEGVDERVEDMGDDDDDDDGSDWSGWDAEREDTRTIGNYFESLEHRAHNLSAMEAETTQRCRDPGDHP